MQRCVLAADWRVHGSLSVSRYCYAFLLVYTTEVSNAVQDYYPSAPSGWIHGTIAPQYTVNDLVFNFGAVFVIGIIFLCFDIRARDVQNNISEVIDSMPANNVEVTVGRMVGILLLVLIPMTIFLGGITFYEVLAHYLEIPYRYGLLTVTSAWGSIVEMMTFLLLFGSVVAFLAVLLRNRLIVALLSLGLLIGLVALSNQPFLQLEQASIHSDFVSESFSAVSFVIHLAMLLLSIAFITFASSILPRTQPQRQLIGVGGGVCLLAGIMSITGVMSSNDKSNSLRQEWRTAHDSQDIKAFPDIQHLEGSIRLWPNDKLQFDLTLTALTPVSNPTDSVVFSLNPGYTIENVYIDGNELDLDLEEYSFEQGLLKVSASKWTDDEHQFRIEAQGTPDERFAYLDEARELSKTPSPWLPRFGTKNYIFHSDFVALMPSIKWYPTSGSATHEDLLENRPRDVFTTDITVSVPQLWKIAMAGSRAMETREWRGKGKLHTVYRFTSQAPVPELALISSKFDQRGTTIEGIRFELLFSKKHTKNLDVLAPYAKDFEDWATKHIRRARELSLEYPYKSFYIVEIPSTLRIYGGGWRMDSVLQPPGMMLVRETTFPTARFETVVGEQDLSWEVSETFARNMVVSYFTNNLQGGSPFAGISRNFVNHQSSPTGRGSTTINYLVEQLSTQLIMQEESLFIPSLWEFGVEPAEADLFDMLYADPERGATRRRLDLLRTPSTWETIEQTPLFALDYQSEPILSFRALLSKSYAIAESMIEYYGAEKVSAVLQHLTSIYAGGYYTLEDFIEVAAKSDIDLNDWVLDWLEGTSLPGFVVADVRVTKLTTEATSPYQTTFVIHNAEPVAGFVEVSSLRNGVRLPDPIFLHGYESVEVAIQTHEPLREILIKPNFAQNRERFPIRLPEYDGKSVSENPTKPLVSKVEWLPQDSTAIVVDDLDPGFSIVGEQQKRKEGFNFPGIEIGPNSEEALDQGLPVRATSLVGEWERKSDPYSYSFGRYRRTLALIARGNQNTYANFAAELPRSGTWQLEYFVPGRVTHVQPYDFVRNSRSLSFGSVLDNPRANPNNPEEHYTLQVNDGQTTWDEQFDIANATYGWNTVNTFDLSSETVEVLVSDFAGRADVIVYADAIRWTPVDSD